MRRYINRQSTQRARGELNPTAQVRNSSSTPEVLRARFISQVALAGLLISDFFKSKYTRNILLRSRLQEFAATKPLFQVLRSCYVIYACLVDCLSESSTELEKGKPVLGWS
jgi:hypothetical protein